MANVIKVFLIGIFACMMSATCLGVARINVGYFDEWVTPNLEAKEKKVFDEKLGLHVNWMTYTTGIEMTEAMLAGDIDIAYSQGLAPFVNAVNQRVPITLVDIAVTYGANSTTCIVSDDSGISSDNAEDLEGTTVGLPVGTMADYVFRETMSALDVDISKIKIKNMLPARAASALTKGEVPMVCLFGGSSVAKALKVGERLITPEEASDAGISGIDIVSVFDKYLKENPRLVRDFIKVTHEYNDRYSAGDSDMKIIAEEAHMDMTDLDAQMVGRTFPSTSEIQSKYMGKDGLLLKRLEEMGDMFSTSDNPALDDYSKVISTDYLPK